MSTAKEKFELARQRYAATFERHLDNGVNFIRRDVYIEPEVVIAPGATILPGCILRGKDGKEEPLRTVEDIAAYFVEEILRVRPKAKLTIVGFCEGGMIGYEMAVQLTRRGVEVKTIAAVGTGAHGEPF